MSAKDLLACSQARGQVHTTNTTTYPGPPIFVADTMTRVKNYNHTVPCNLVANHTPPSVGHHVIGCAPLNKKLAQPFVSTPSPSEARKVGDHTPHKIPLVYKTTGFITKHGCCALNR
jgi:hypothetical protein